MAGKENIFKKNYLIVPILKFSGDFQFTLSLLFPAPVKTDNRQLITGMGEKIFVLILEYLWESL